MEEGFTGRFVPFEIVAKLLVSLGIDLLVGFEREWAHKDLGVRTFALVSLHGMLTALESSHLAWIGMAAVIVSTTVMNVGNLQLHRDLESRLLSAYWSSGPSNDGYDLDDFKRSVQSGNFPSVSFIKAQAYQDGHGWLRRSAG